MEDSRKESLEVNGQLIKKQTCTNDRAVIFNDSVILSVATNSTFNIDFNLYFLCGHRNSLKEFFLYDVSFLFKILLS
jgi:hypothetical protein